MDVVAGVAGGVAGANGRLTCRVMSSITRVKRSPPILRCQQGPLLLDSIQNPNMLSQRLQTLKDILSSFAPGASSSFFLCYFKSEEGLMSCGFSHLQIPSDKLFISKLIKFKFKTKEDPIIARFNTNAVDCDWLRKSF